MYLHFILKGSSINSFHLTVMDIVSDLFELPPLRYLPICTFWFYKFPVASFPPTNLLDEEYLITISQHESK